MNYLVHGLGRIGNAFIRGANKHKESFGFDYKIYTHDKDVNKKPDYSGTYLELIVELPSLIHIVAIDTNLSKDSHTEENKKFGRNWNSDCYRIIELVEEIVNIRGKDNHKADIVIIESTIESGTMQLLNEMFPEWDFVYSPERYNEDVLLKNKFEMDPFKLIAYKPKQEESYYDNLNSSLQYYFEINFINGVKVYIDGTYEEVELAKIIENAKRLVEIQFINEMNLEMSKKYPQVDFGTVVSLMNSKKHTNVTPGLIGGGCIPVDPLFLDSSSQILSSSFKSLLNQSNEICHKISDLLHRSEVKTVMLMGSAYKANSTTENYSRYHNIFTKLKKEHKNMQFSIIDHNIDSWGTDFNSEEFKDSFIELLKTTDLVLVGANHTITEYGKTYLELAMEHSKNVIDLNTFKIRIKNN